MTLRIDTRASEPKKLLLDGQEYNLLGLDHVSPDAEDEVTALFAQYGRLGRRLELEKKRETGKKIATKLRALRVEIIGLLTDIPADTVAGLQPSVQVQILEALYRIVEGDDDELEDNDSEEDDGDGASPGDDSL